MSSIRKVLTLYICIAIGISMLGCSTTAPREAIFREDAVPMREIYHQAVTHRAYPRAGRVTVNGNIDTSGDTLSDWAREQSNETRNLFPQGPNPTLLMYVFPHITADGTPVPGFTTPFKLYESDYFVLPGEVTP